MRMDAELLKIAKMDLRASRVLYENRLYPQSIFYFQQSVEKACKAYALLTNQVSEIELKKKISHDAIKIYEGAIKQQVIIFRFIKENIDKLPKLKTMAIFRDLDAEGSLSEFEIALSEIEEIRKERDDLICISTSEIHHFLREIEQIRKDMEKGRQDILKFKLTENNWNEMKSVLLEFYIYLLKLDSTQFEEIKRDLDKEDTRLSIEKSIKNSLELLFITLSISVPLYYLTIVSLPHSTITRYPDNGFTPTKIYTKGLPIVKLLPKLLEVQDTVLKGLKTLNGNLGNRTILQA